MKIHKMVCLDQELVSKLHNENVSALCNELLWKHVNASVPKTLEERKQRIEELKLQAEYEKKRKELKDGRK